MKPAGNSLVIHSYASSAGTVGVAEGLAAVKDATSSDTLAQAPRLEVPFPDAEVALELIVVPAAVGAVMMLAEIEGYDAREL